MSPDTTRGGRGTPHAGRSRRDCRAADIDRPSAGQGSELSYGPVHVGQRRLEALLRANLAISGEHSLAQVLRRTVNEARELTQARFGGIAVLDDNGTICELIHAEVDDHAALRTVSAASAVLGMLMAEPRPVRVRSLVDHPRSVDLFPGDSQVGPFLGVQLRAHDVIFGHLYLTDPPAEEFTAEDEEIVTALAAIAGMAVENARLIEDQERSRERLQATLEVTASLIGRSAEEALDTLARQMQRVARSDFVLVVLPLNDATLMVETSVGEGTEHIAGFAFPRSGSLSDVALTRTEAVLVEDASRNVENRPLLRLSEEFQAGPMMFVPMLGQRGRRGVLAVGRRRGKPCFAQRDVAPATAFANHAAVALELADGRLSQQKVLILEERQHIAAELHDKVLQRLFATGMSMQAVAADLDPAHAQRVADAIDSTNDAIRCIRSVIRNLHGLDSADPWGKG